MILQVNPLELQENIGGTLEQLAKQVDENHRTHLKSIRKEGKKRKPNQSRIDYLEETYNKMKQQLAASAIPQIQELRQRSGLEELDQTELQKSTGEFVGQIEHARREEEYGTTGIGRAYRFIRKHPIITIGTAAIAAATAAVIGLEVTYPIFDIYDAGFGRSGSQIRNDPVEAATYFSDRISIRRMLWDTSWVYGPIAAVAGGAIGGGLAWGLRKRAERKGSLDKDYHTQTKGLITSYAENYVNGTLTHESQMEAARKNNETQR